MPCMASLSDALPEGTHVPVYIGHAGRSRELRRESRRRSSLPATERGRVAHMQRGVGWGGLGCRAGSCCC